MNIQILQVPYDSGHENRRTGRGPHHFIQHGVSHMLEKEAHTVEILGIESKAAFRADIETTDPEYDRDDIVLYAGFEIMKAVVA